MKKMSKILESNEEMKWEVKINLSLFVDASNEGEAAYLAEKALSNLDVDKDMVISSISKKDNIKK